MKSDIEIIELLAGIGIFLFGMFELEESLKELSGGTFRKLIRNFTKNWFRSVLTGIAATTILQSSSAVSLMVLAFAGAGIIGMESAIGIVIGSNLGTTFTSWIVATVGFKLKIELLALPFIGLGGLGLIFFGKTGRATNISRFLVGFGFLFLGLDYMKSSIDSLAMHYDLSALKGQHPVFYVFTGLVLTVIVQSSSAAVAIILSAIHAEVITFKLAAFMIIGTNIGTTITIFIGSIGTQVIKKQIALSHLLFNGITALVVLLLMPFILFVIRLTINIDSDPVTGLALFHTLFNLIGVILLLPWIGVFTRLIVWLMPPKKSTVTYCIHTLKPDFPEAGIAALKTEIRYLIQEVIRYHLRLFKMTRRELFASLFKKEDDTSGPTPAELYEKIKLQEAEIYTFAAGLQTHELRDEEARELNKLLHATRSAVAAAKIMKDVQHNLREAENSGKPEVEKLLKTIREKWAETLNDLLEILNEKETTSAMSRMHHLMQRNKEDDIGFTHMLTQVIASKKIGPEEIPPLITISRASTLSVLQLIHAVRDLLFTEKEAEIVEKLGEPIA
jgi:phosphate:Na+ symporter